MRGHMADINLPVVGKTSQKTFFIVAAVGIGVVAYIIYKKAGASQKSNMGKASGTGMVSHPNKRARYHQRWEWA